MNSETNLKSAGKAAARSSRTISLAGAFAIVALSLVGCSPSAGESREAGSKLEVEVCFTNELTSTPTQISTTADGSGTLWQTTLQPGQTGCSHSKSSTYDLQGYIQVRDEPEEFAFRFHNPNVGYPEGALISRPINSTTKSGSGVCQGFSAGESTVLDYGSARLFIERKTDSQYKRFRVVVMPTEAKTAMNPCSVSASSQGANG